MINLYLADEREYTRGLAHKLLDEKVIDFCLADHLPWKQSVEHDDRIVEIETRTNINMEYSGFIDLNDLPAVSKELMEAMLPYESMAIKMDLRILNYPISEYSEGKRKYLQHLRYWNYMLDKYQINLIYTGVVPHNMGMYVVYGLSRVRNIPMLILNGGVGLLKNRRWWGSSVEKIGESIPATYQSLVENNVTEIVYDSDVERDVKEFYNAESCNTKARESDELLRKRRITFFAESYKAIRKQTEKIFVKYIFNKIIKGKSLPTPFDIERIWIRRNCRMLNAYRYFSKHQLCSMRDYNRITEKIDYSKPYIVFFLQMYPEASTMPLAGVFEEQYNSIQLLARAAEKVGVNVYVRYHPAATFRSKDFFADICNTRNVSIIDTSEPSRDVINRSVCVATQTGTCIIESLLLKKPCIVFGEGNYYKGRPGLYEIVDEDQGTDVIRSIMKGVEISDLDIKRYIYALQLESILEVDLSELNKYVFEADYSVPVISLDDRVRLIKDFIGKNNISSAFRNNMEFC